jgi:hypothetical protein
MPVASSLAWASSRAGPRRSVGPRETRRLCCPVGAALQADLSCLYRPGPGGRTSPQHLDGAIDGDVLGDGEGPQCRRPPPQVSLSLMFCWLFPLTGSKTPGRLMSSAAPGYCGPDARPRRVRPAWHSAQARVVRDYPEWQLGEGRRHCGSAGNPSGNPVVVTTSVRM